MNTARIVVPTLAISAGGVAAYLAGGSDTTRPTQPAAHPQTVEVLAVTSGLGRPVSPGNLQWRAWPAANPGNHFFRRIDRSDATTGSSAGARQTGTLSRALRRITDINMVDNRTDDQAPQRGESVGVVRYGVPGSTTTQK